MPDRSLTFLIPAVLLMAGCGEREPTAATAGGDESPPVQASSDQSDASGTRLLMCPLQVPDTQVASRFAPDGVALIYQTRQATQVDDLRQRVQQMIEYHQMMQQRRDRLHQVVHGQGGQADSFDLPYTCSVENIDRGSRILLVLEDVSHLDDLRARVRRHLERSQLLGDGCPMMSMMREAQREHDLLAR